MRQRCLKNLKLGYITIKEPNMSKKTKLGQGLIKALKSIIVEQENSDAQKKLDKLINASEKLGKAVAMRSR